MDVLGETALGLGLHQTESAHLDVPEVQAVLEIPEGPGIGLPGSGIQARLDRFVTPPDATEFPMDFQVPRAQAAQPGIRGI
jgi:hypothetical protein